MSTQPNAKPPINHEIAFHAAASASAAQLVNVVPTLYNPGPGNEIAVPGSGREYHVEKLHISINSGSVAITLLNNDGVVWGPHTFPAGFHEVSFPSSLDKARSGKALGEGKIPLLSSGASFTGRIDLFGYSVPTLS